MVEKGRRQKYVKKLLLLCWLISFCVLVLFKANDLHYYIKSVACRDLAYILLTFSLKEFSIEGVVLN